MAGQPFALIVSRPSCAGHFVSTAQAVEHAQGMLPTGIRRELGLVAASTIIVEAVVLGFDHLRHKLNEREKRRKRERRPKKGGRK
jgi:hypothetical protein